MLIPINFCSFLELFKWLDNMDVEIWRVGGRVTEVWLFSPQHRCLAINDMCIMKFDNGGHRDVL